MNDPGLGCIDWWKGQDYAQEEGQHTEAEEREDANED